MPTPALDCTFRVIAGRDKTSLPPARRKTCTVNTESGRYDQRIFHTSPWPLDQKIGPGHLYFREIPPSVYAHVSHCWSSTAISLLPFQEASRQPRDVFLLDTRSHIQEPCERRVSHDPLVVPRCFTFPTPCRVAILLFYLNMYPVTRQSSLQTALHLMCHALHIGEVSGHIQGITARHWAAISDQQEAEEVTTRVLEPTLRRRPERDSIYFHEQPIKTWDYSPSVCIQAGTIPSSPQGHSLQRAVYRQLTFTEATAATPG